MKDNAAKNTTTLGALVKQAKRDKFVELAEKRTVNAIKAIRIISKLGNKSHYDYDEQDVRKIVLALNKEVESLKVKMTSARTQEKVEFKL